MSGDSPRKLSTPARRPLAFLLCPLSSALCHLPFAIGSADDLAALGVEGEAEGLADGQAARVADHAAVQVEDLAVAVRVAEGIAGDGPQGVVRANGVDGQVARGVVILLFFASA